MIRLSFGSLFNLIFTMNALKKFIAEFIGTFVLVLFGCGTAAVVHCSADPNVAYLLTALAFGLSIVAMAYSIGNISGCHVNPAVSIGMLASGRMGFGSFLGYVIFQCLGAIAAAAVLMSLLGTESGLGANALYHNCVCASLLVEGILSFVFVLAVLGATAKASNGAVAGLVIGLSLTLVHILGISFTGTSVNPARSLGPALFMGGSALDSLWVFIAAPLVGGLLAAIVYRLLSCGCCCSGKGKEEA